MERMCFGYKLTKLFFNAVFLVVVVSICGTFVGFSVRMACAQGGINDNEEGGIALSFEKEEGAEVSSSSGEAEEEVGETAKTAKFMEVIRRNWDISIDGMSSLFFTYWQHQSIVTAKKSHGLSRPTTEAELKKELENLELDPERRYVSLGGIVYKGKNNWTIWINGERVTPEALPPEALDLRVYEDYIELKWLDEYTNSVFPLRLRAHQRFNLDQRIFLPG